jgi:hypothetical protein
MRWVGVWGRGRQTQDGVMRYGDRVMVMGGDKYEVGGDLYGGKVIG